MRERRARSGVMEGHSRAGSGVMEGEWSREKDEAGRERERDTDTGRRRDSISATSTTDVSELVTFSHFFFKSLIMTTPPAIRSASVRHVM